jgi:hypothetical protein
VGGVGRSSEGLGPDVTEHQGRGALGVGMLATRACYEMFNHVYSDFFFIERYCSNYIV